MISSLNNEIAKLQAQVMELEESRTNLQEQNKSNTKGGVSEEDLNSQIDAACVLVEKLINENAELVEKVNELCIKLNQSHPTSPPSPKTLSIEVQKSESLEEIPIHDFKDIDTAVLERNLSENEPEETVPVSLNPNGETDVESQVLVSGEEGNDGVPLVDAPLIGAPFRLVSFVARYVSGADLAEKK